MAGIRGLKALQTKLKNIPIDAREKIKDALAAGATEMIGTMRNLAPKEYGDLERSIVATYGSGKVPKYAGFVNRRGRRPVHIDDPDLSVRITAGNSSVRYAHLVEFGTAPHPQGGKFKGTMHPGTSAQPFFYPGYRANKKQVKAKMRKAIREIAKAAGAK